MPDETGGSPANIQNTYRRVRGGRRTMKQDAVKVLVVDDEEDLELLIRQKFRRRIRGGELEFMFAHNGREGLLQLARNRDIHLVFSDINMPVMDGLTMLHQLAEADLDVQAVIVSAYGDMDNIRTAMNRGAFDFLTKPIDFADLEITLEKGIAHVRQLQDTLETRDKLVSIKRELEVASQVQMSALPAELPANEFFDVKARVIPAKEVGGDFYDYFQIDDHRLAIAIADVAGKGIPAALFAMVTRALIKSVVSQYESPAAALRAVNEQLCDGNDSCVFITTFFGVLDLRSGAFLYSNAGHNPPRLLRAKGDLEVVAPTDNLVLGIDDGEAYANAEVQLYPGDALILYTDGVTEAENAEEEEYGDHRLDQVLAAAGSADSAATIEAIVSSVRDFAGEAQQSDDITCLVSRFLNRQNP